MKRTRGRPPLSDRLTFFVTAFVSILWLEYLMVVATPGADEHWPVIIAACAATAALLGVIGELFDRWA